MPGMSFKRCVISQPFCRWWSPIECFCWKKVAWKVNFLWQLQWTFQRTRVFVDGEVLFKPLLLFKAILLVNSISLSNTDSSQPRVARLSGTTYPDRFVMYSHDGLKFSQLANPRFFSGMLLTSMILGLPRDEGNGLVSFFPAGPGDVTVGTIYPNLPLLFFGGGGLW